MLTNHTNVLSPRESMCTNSSAQSTVIHMFCSALLVGTMKQVLTLTASLVGTMKHLGGARRRHVHSGDLAVDASQHEVVKAMACAFNASQNATTVSVVLARRRPSACARHTILLGEGRRS